MVRMVGDLRILLQVALDDPDHLPEHLALVAVRRCGARAAAAVAGQRTATPSASDDEISAAVVARRAAFARDYGALAGSPLVLFSLPTFLIVALEQATVVLAVAAAYGNDPRHPVRASELLLVFGVYSSREVAEASLRQTRMQRSEPRAGPRLARGTRMRLIGRLATLLGSANPARPPARNRLRRRAIAVGDTLLMPLGFVFPTIWVPITTWLAERRVWGLGERAMATYGGPSAPAAAVARQSAVLSRFRTRRFAAHSGRMLLLLPLILAAICLGAGWRLVGDNHVTAGIVLVGTAVVVNLAWFVRARTRARRLVAVEWDTTDPEPETVAPTGGPDERAPAR